MAGFTVEEMLEMQRALNAHYLEKWGPLDPSKGRQQFLWMLGEAGEVIDLLKKNERALAEPGPVRDHFVEEMADVLMYFFDVMLCYGVTGEELRTAYVQKFHRNLGRW